MKAAVAGLVVLGLLALGLVALQVTGPDDAGSPRSGNDGTLSRLEERLNGAKRLRAADVPAGTACLDAPGRRLVVSAFGACSFALPNRVRRVELDLRAGASVRLAVAGERAGAQFVSAGPGPFTIKVYDTGSVLSIVCVSAATCQLGLPA